MPTPLILLLLLLLSGTAFASPQGRFFLEGDGLLHIVNAKTGAGGGVRYRLPDGSYPAAAQAKIDRIFGAAPGEGISPRLVSLLDYLQDHFGGGMIRIVSGYRSPTYNQRLRQKGKLAAQTSLHLEGMAADVEMAGVEAEKLWQFVRGLDCCGVGYYHGNGIHLDTGPSRFWDETSTRVDEDLGARNQLIFLRTDRDIYLPGEAVRLTLHRITDYPFGLRPRALLLKGGKGWKEVNLIGAETNCVSIKDRHRATSLSWVIPEGFFSSDKVRIEVTFCDKPFPEMPDRTASNPITILNRFVRSHPNN